MKRSTTASAFLSLCLLPALSSCRGGVADPAADYQQLAALVPADALVFARLRSIDWVHERAKELAASADRDYRQRDLDRWLRMVPFLGDIDHIDRSRPIGVALRIVGGVSPAPVVLVPTADPDAYVATLPQGGGKAVVAGGYVAIPFGPGYQQPTTPAPLAAALGPAPVRVRADVQQLAKMFRGPIEMGLKQVERVAAADTPPGVEVDMQAVIGMYLDGIRAVLESATTIDLAADAPDGAIDLDLRVQVDADSPMDGWSSPPSADLAALAARTEPDAAFHLIADVDYRKLRARIQPFQEQLLQVYPPTMREWMQSTWGVLDQFYGLMAGGMVASGGFDHGLKMSFWAGTGDGAATKASLLTMLDAMKLDAIGAEITERAQSEIGGASVLDTAVRFDRAKLLSALPKGTAGSATGGASTMLELMFGAESTVRSRFAVGSSATAGRVGGDDAWRAGATDLLRPPTRPTPAWAAPLCERLRGANPAMIEHFDFLEILRQMGGALPGPSPFGQVPDDATAPMTITGGVRGREWLFGVRFDLAAMLRSAPR